MDLSFTALHLCGPSALLLWISVLYSLINQALPRYREKPMVYRSQYYPCFQTSSGSIDHAYLISSPALILNDMVLPPLRHQIPKSGLLAEPRITFSELKGLRKLTLTF